MAIKSVKVAADFETTTDPNDCRVWAACAVDIESLETVFIGNTIDSFFDWLQGKNTVAYFHNLKFDGEFIVSWLLRNGYTLSDSRQPRTFSTLISDTGQWYSITVIFEKKNKKYKKVTFRDSLKKLPFKVSVIAKAFELEDEKLEIDYQAYRAPGHELTEEERRYIVADCRIVAAALKIQFSKGLSKMTTASDAMNGYKQIIAKNNFAKLFPVFPVELDANIRRAYKGGFVYLNPRYKNMRGLQGITLDVNSLYPSVMHDCVLPYGYPIFFEGEPDPDDRYNLFIVRIKTRFKIKKGRIPMIQLKNSNRFVQTEYITDSDVYDEKGLLNDDPIELVLTSVDLTLFLEQYDVEYIEYKDGFKFKGKSGMFTEYIDYWMHIKETNTGAMRQLAKLMLNSLYGRFALNPKAATKFPVIDDAGIVHHVANNERNLEIYDPDIDADELRDPVYTALAAFVTAYAREKTVRSAQNVFERFIYADTDSLSLIGFDVPPELDVHPTKLGAWKHEGEFTDSFFIRAKTYAKTIDGKLKVTCAGMPDSVKEKVTYENFHSGSTFTGKLVPRRCVGGVVLVDTTFTIN